MFDPETGQAKIYKMAIAPIVEEVLEGFNCTIFAYGQTGTGKTYTMEVSLASFSSLLLLHAPVNEHACHGMQRLAACQAQETEI